ncbi:uncharacterized protein LOC127094454 [Lathyrus oleraceus]|uniref:uncharacterized protein LOC127094454 n=1 Tax=Pisum sativum TaxID=3888 RepID=UPI0021D1DC09|nr:uncharacterized protein LOC127094454 [Pisum sativum]
MPTYKDASVSAIEESDQGKLIRKVEEIQTPITRIRAQLLKSGLIPEELVAEDNNKKLRNFIQQMLDRGELQINCRVKSKRQEEIALVDISYDEVKVEIPISPLVIEFPAPFAYKYEKAVPWIYQPKAFKQGKEDQPLMINEPNVTSIMGPAGMTRSGRVFAPRTDDTSAKTKGKKVDVQIPVPNQEMQDMHLSPKAAVTREEAEEFLRIIKKRNYKVVDQLNQTPSKISMLSPLLNSEAYMNSLLKVLSIAHITKDITIEQFDDVITSVTTGNFWGSNDDELPIEGKNHNKALNISLKCIDIILSRVLVDTGSSLNVMLKTTLIKLLIEGISMKPNTLIVKAFDGSRRAMIGEVDLPIKIGPTIFNITFQMIVIGGEEDILVSHLTSLRYIEVDGEITETPFQSLEVVNMMVIQQTLETPKSGLSMASWQGAKAVMESENA